MRSSSICAGMAVFASLLSTPAGAQAVSCRGYPPSVMAQVKSRVEAVRLIEREAADRLLGLDTRVYPFLAGEVRKAADVIADEKALKKDEEELRRCRNWVQPVRGICRGAALALAAALDEEEAGKATKESKQAYVDAMPHCERLMGLSPLSTAWRMPN
jgi:hypothetical protein